MPASARRALGAFVIVGWLIFWIALAALVADRIAAAPWYAHLVFYAVAGVAWVIPLKPLFAWMAGAAPTAPPR